MSLPGKGPAVPIPLTRSPDVSMVSFTGSAVAGRKVAAAAGEGLKHVLLELGGKNACVVFDDADLESAVRNALAGGFFNKGEACTASSRLLVQDGVYERFVTRLAEAVKKLRVGDGMDPKTHIGPTVSKQQQQKVLDHIQLGINEGAKIAMQANLPDDEKLRDGYFIPPTLFRDVTRDMRIASEEMFGPVVTVTRFGSEDEAVDNVNKSRYGLNCIVWTKDTDKLLRMSRRVEVGMVLLNNYRRNSLGVPFGGVKDTGGAREHSLQTLDEFSTIKVV
jgi:acyl-CoA reductase-like NAD-dependent aldehyde dehydrogenase